MKTYKFQSSDKKVDLNVITDGMEAYSNLFINDIQGTLSEAEKVGIDLKIQGTTEVELMQKAINAGVSLTVYNDDGEEGEILNLAGAIIKTPEDGATDIAVAGDIEWYEVFGADSYDVYLWKSSESKPSTPTSEDQTEVVYSYTGLDNDAEYSVQIVAKSSELTSESAVFTFTTASA